MFDSYFSDTEATESSSLSPASPVAYDETVAAACELREGAAASQQLGEAIRSAGNVLRVSRLEQSDSIAAQRVGQTVTESMPDPRVAEGALGSAPFVLPDSSQRVISFGLGTPYQWAADIRHGRYRPWPRLILAR